MKGVKWGLIQFINRQNQEQSVTLTGQKEFVAASGSADTPSTVAHVPPKSGPSSPIPKRLYLQPPPWPLFGHFGHVLSNEKLHFLGQVAPSQWLTSQRQNSCNRSQNKYHQDAL